MENVGEVGEYARGVRRAFGARLRELRLARGWTQEQLAQEMAAHGFTIYQTTVAKIENGGRPTEVGEVTAFARVFGIPINALFEITDDAKDRMLANRLQEILYARDDELARLEARRNEILDEKREIEETLSELLSNEMERSEGGYVRPVGP